MTERLDYFDAYQQRFDARVVAIEERNGAPAVILDRTCFYPTSGGQLHDTGFLDGLAVNDVVVEQGVILHLLTAPPPFSPGAAVAGVIDWSRRYDHMQQHSGQHLLSQLIYQRFGFETVSVHFGREESTLDLDVAALPASFMQEVELAANELAYYALDIRAYFIDDAAVSLLPLRRPPAVSGQIRIVEIDGFDYSACGGTHVHTTAEIAPIKLVRQERRRNQTRLTFLCGLRAFRDYVDKARSLAECAALFSTDAAAVPALVQKMQLQLRELEKSNTELQQQMLAHIVADLIERAPRVDGVAVVEHCSASAPLETLKQMATLLRAQPQVVGLLASTAGDKVNVVFCRSDDASIHVGDLLREALAHFGGRGGGRPEYAQGGGAPVDAAADVLAYARQQLIQKH
jgi:alanyl-tRNA synthetase